MSGARKKWPIGPLEAAVQSTGKCVHRLALENGLSVSRAVSFADMFERGRAEGSLTLYAMDSLCIEVLRKHPMEVYGDEYLNPKYDSPILKKPCIRCGGEKGPGSDQWKCGSCVEAAKWCACGCGQPTASTKARYAHKSHAYRKAA